jgi:hypothetical protein
MEDVKQHNQVNGPWKYSLSQFYYKPALSAAVERIAAKKQSKAAA